MLCRWIFRDDGRCLGDYYQHIQRPRSRRVDSAGVVGAEILRSYIKVTVFCQVVRAQDRGDDAEYFWAIATAGSD